MLNSLTCFLGQGPQKSWPRDQDSCARDVLRECVQVRGQVREQPNPMGSSGVGGVPQGLSYLEANELGFHIPGTVSHWLWATPGLPRPRHFSPSSGLNTVCKPIGGKLWTHTTGNTVWGIHFY